MSRIVTVIYHRYELSEVRFMAKGEEKYCKTELFSTVYYPKHSRLSPGK
jgi:hypothetical protein